MAGRQASSAAMLVAAAVGCVVAGLSGAAHAQTAASAGAPDQSGTIARPVVVGQPIPTALQSQTASSDQNFERQQGVAVPQRPANRPRNIGVQLSAGAIYDTNALRSNSQIARARGLARRDVRFPLGVVLDIFVPDGPNLFFLNGNVGYDFNLRNTQRNGQNIGLHAGYQRNIGSCAVALSGLLHRNRTQLGNNGLVILPIRNIETSTGLDGSVTCGSTGGLKPFASLGYSQGSNSETFRKPSDYNTTTYGGGLTFGQPQAIEIGLIGSIDDTKYPNRIGLSNFISTRFQAKSIGVYFNRAAARQLRARVQLNYTAVKSNGAGQSFSGLSGQADATFVPGGRFVFTASFSRAATPSLQTSADYHVSTVGGLSVSAAVSPKTGFSLGFQNRHRKYFASFFDPVHPLRNDTFRSIDGSVRYQATPKFSLDASVGRESRRANDPFFNFSGMRFGISANLSL